MNLLKKVAADPLEKRSHHAASYNDLSAVFSGLLGKNLSEEERSKKRDTLFSYADVGKLYSFAVFAAPSYLRETRLAYTKDAVQRRKKEFQEYLRVSLSYVSLEQDLRKNSSEKALLENTIPMPATVHSKESLEGMLVFLLQADAADKTYETIGKAVVKGANIYSKRKQKDHVSAKSKYKVFSEYNLIQKQLSNLIDNFLQKQRETVRSEEP